MQTNKKPPAANGLMTEGGFQFKLTKKCFSQEHRRLVGIVTGKIEPGFISELTSQFT